MIPGICGFFYGEKFRLQMNVKKHIRGVFFVRVTTTRMDFVWSTVLDGDTSFASC